MKSFGTLSSVVLPLIFGGLLFVIWLLIGSNLVSSNVEAGLTEDQSQSIRRILLPYPGEIVEAAWEERAKLMTGVKSTFTAAIIGFLAAVVGGYGISLLMAPSITLKKTIYPWVLVLQMTPVVILAPIIAIWVKEPPIAPVVLITFLIGFFPVLANSTMGLVSVDKNLVDLFDVCCATKGQELLHLRIPNSLPYLMTGMKIAGTLAPIGAITGDLFLGSADGNPGLGYLTIEFKQTVKTPALFATAATACIMGFMFVGMVNLIHWRCLKDWHESVVNKD